MQRTLALIPSPRVLKPRILVALAWIGSLLLVYHCCRFVTHKVYIDIERALVQPKESPPLLGYLLLLRYYSASYSVPLPKHDPVAPTLTARPADVQAKMDALRCRLHNFPEEMPNITRDTILPLASVCRHAPSKHFLTLFTTMYDRKDKIYIFNNTVSMWPQLQGVKPVLFVTPGNQTSAAMVTMLTRACNLGWDVIVAPHCNNDSYPVLRSMWQTVQAHYDSAFYGYTNGDIIFDDTLTLTLRHLAAQDPHIFRRRHIISGQRHNAFVSYFFLTLLKRIL